MSQAQARGLCGDNLWQALVTCCGHYAADVAAGASWWESRCSKATTPGLPKARSSQKSICASPGALSLLTTLCTAQFIPDTKDRERGVLQKDERRRGQHRAPQPCLVLPG